MDNLLQGQKVAVIGGAGFIGHNLALGLAQLGADVAVVDSLQVNNLLTFSSFDEYTPNQELYFFSSNVRTNSRT